MPDDLRYRRLDDQLGRIYREIQTLRINQHVFWEVQAIIRNNPRLHTPSTFYGWMGNMYAAAMAATVRRLVDHRKGTVSLVRLMQEVRKEPELFSRSAYKKRFDNPSLPPDFIDRDYDRLVGVGRREPDPAVIDQEIRDLEAKTAKLKRFADAHIAHLADSPPTELPKFQDLDNAIDALEDLLKRYLHLFRGEGLTFVLPVWQYDWKAIFRFPWIEGSNSPDSDGQKDVSPHSA